MVQRWRGNVADHLCVLWRTLTLWRGKKPPANKQGGPQHNYGYPDDPCNEYWKAIWICIHTKWQCCLNLQRMVFVEWAQDNEVSFNNIRFSDEAHFHLDAVVN
jgi:hypothetical protein